MLVKSKLNALTALVSDATYDELIWMNGFISGAVSVNASRPAVAAASVKIDKITIVYGTESGNSKKLATGFATKVKQNGIAVKVASLDQYRLNDLPNEGYFLVVVSTQGDGEPPAAAKKFYDHLFADKVTLSNLKYGVIALGDSAYPLFCKTGADIDAQLQQLGGTRIATLQKCDTDYEPIANEWFEQVLSVLKNGTDGGPRPQTHAVKKVDKKTYAGTVVTNINLNDKGSEKKTHHLEITAEGLVYEPGDSIGIIPENQPETINAILETVGINADKIIQYRGEEKTLFQLFKKELNIVYLPERIVKQYGTIVNQEIPETKIGLLDLLKIYPVKDAQQFEQVVNILEPITPRLYSVSSSLNAHTDEVHITVCRDKFYINSEERYGLCSGYLGQLSENIQLNFYVHKNNQFRLPHSDKNIIMIGPGTGIAPFRAFLEERDATRATGKNWLFFGDQHFTTDFLYQTEIQNWFSTGLLTKVNTAFSRDQPEKVYVQHKMLANAAELYDWIHSGAYIYICGTKEPMSVDVQEALQLIITEQGGYTAEQAKAYLEQLEEEGRLLKDVY